MSNASSSGLRSAADNHSVCVVRGDMDTIAQILRRRRDLSEVAEEVLAVGNRDRDS